MKAAISPCVGEKEFAGGGGGGAGRCFSRQVETRAPPTTAEVLQNSESRHQVGNFHAQPCCEMFDGLTQSGSLQQSVIFATEKIVA